MSNYFICPHCGAEVDVDALACPQCGSDDETGWSEETKYDGLYLEQELNFHSPEEEKGWLKYVILTLLALILTSFITTTVPWGVYLIPLIIIAFLVSYFLIEMLPNMRTQKVRKLYDMLLLRARGDEAMVERWISYERSRTPEADEIDLMEAALYRWQRDNS